MATIKLPGVESWRDRHGRVRHYYRPTKAHKRVTLPGEAGSAEFMAAYHAALDATKPAESKIRTAAPGTMAALAASYLASSDFADLKPSTRKVRRAMLGRFLEEHGGKSVATIERRHVVAILDKFADRPGAANNLRKMLKVLFTRAIDLGQRKDDPTHRIKSRKTGHWRSWTDEEIAAMEKRWPIGTRQRLAFALHIYTGQRRSDVVKMTRADVSGGKIRVVQFKTGTKVVVPVHRDLKPVLDASPLGALYLLETNLGRPFSVAGYGNWLRDSHRAAGLPEDCVTHGLRKAAGRLLAEAGASTKQIMAVLGLKSLELAELYTRDAEQEHLAEGGMTVWEGKTAR